MKNFFQTLSGRANSHKFIWKNKAYNDALKNLHEDTKERIDEMKLRSSDMTKLEKDVLRVDIEVGQGFKKFETEFNSKKPIFTNADLKNLAKYTVNSISGGEIGKMYRTEMVARINEFLMNKSETDISNGLAGELLEKCMAALPYRSGSASKALYDAMKMVQHDRNPGNKLLPSFAKKFLNKKEREKLAKKMESGYQNVKLGEKFSVGDYEYDLGECEILTGGSMTKISPKLTNSLILKNVIKIEEDGEVQFLAQLKNGCEGNLVKITPKEIEKDSGLEKMVWDQKIAIGDLPPDIFGEFFKLNPNLHWVEYEDLYNYMDGLPEGKRLEMEQSLELYVTIKSAKGIQDQLRADIANPATPPFQRKLFEAQLKLTMGDDKNVNAGAAELDALIADPSTPADILAMAKDVRAQVEQQFLAENSEALKYRDMNGLWMFRTHLVSREDKLNDDWWITDKLQFLWTNDDSEDKAELLLGKELIESIEELENMMQTDPTIKTLDEALLKLTPAKSAKFKTEYDKFIATEMKGTTLDKPANKITKQEMKNMPEAWLKMADELRGNGQYGQAAEIYESVFGKKFLEDKTSSFHKGLTTKEEQEINQSVSLKGVRENLDKSKMLEGMAEAEILKLVKHTYTQTLIQLKEKAVLKKSVDEMDPATVFPDKNSAKFKAMQNYQDMLGLEKGWDVSDETWDTITKEIAINVALIAVSGGVATVGRMAFRGALLAGTRSAATRGVSRGIIKAGMTGTRGITIGGRNLGRITTRGVIGASAEGAVFHLTENKLVHGEFFDEDSVRGIAMSAMMFNLFRGGNKLYSKTLGKGLEGRIGTQFHMPDFATKSSARLAELNGGTSVSRLAVLGKASGHKLARGLGQTLPFFAINGAVTNLTSDENHFTWENLGKDGLTLAALSLLGRGRRLGKERLKPEPFKKEKQLKLPPHKEQLSLPAHKRTLNLPAHKEQLRLLENKKQLLLNSHKEQLSLPAHKRTLNLPAHKEQLRLLENKKQLLLNSHRKQSHRTVEEIAKDMHGQANEKKLLFKNENGATPVNAQKSGIDMGLRSEMNVAKKIRGKKIHDKAKLESNKKLEKAQSKLSNVDKTKAEAYENFQKAVKESRNMNPKEARQHVNKVWEKEMGKLAKQKENLAVVRQKREFTRDEQANWDKLKNYKKELKNDLNYDVVIKNIRDRANVKYNTSKENVLENNAYWKGVNIKKVENYEGIKVPMEQNLSSIDFKNTKARNVDGKTRRRSIGNKLEQSGNKHKKNLQDKDLKKDRFRKNNP